MLADGTRPLPIILDLKEAENPSENPEFMKDPHQWEYFYRIYFQVYF